MKTNNVCRQNYQACAPIPFPNAATRRQILNKVLDYLLMGAIGSGLGAMLLFILALA